MRISDWSSDVCSSDLPWQRRATWTGYTTALRVQGAEIDEIDIFGRECAVNLPGRRPMPTHLDDRDALPIWQRKLAQRESRYWRDERAISTDVPAVWSQRPALSPSRESRSAKRRGGNEGVSTGSFRLVPETGQTKK